jgi:hypothetical protein
MYSTCRTEFKLQISFRLENLLTLLCWPLSVCSLFFQILNRPVLRLHKKVLLGGRAPEFLSFYLVSDNVLVIRLKINITDSGGSAEIGMRFGRWWALYVWSGTSQNDGCIRNEQGGSMWIICSAITKFMLSFQPFKESNNLTCLNIQFVPRSKHTPPRF